MEQEMKDALKEISLMYGEKAAELAIEFAFELIEKAIDISENKIDDAFKPALLALKPIAMKLAEDIYKGDNA